MAIVVEGQRPDPDRSVSPQLLIALLGACVGLGLYTLRLALGGSIIEGDILRMLQLAKEHGTPYRDFTVEYAPLEFLLIKFIGGYEYATVALRVGLVSIVGMLAAAAGVGFGWGRRAAAIFLGLGIPLSPFMVLRLDTVPVALAVWGFALNRRGRWRPGGVLIGFAILAKVWPLFLVPALVIRRRWTTLAWLMGCLLAGGVAWLLVGGLHAPVEVASFRGATAWEFESTVGVVVWAVTGQRPFSQAGAPRVGLSTGWENGLLLGLLIVALIFVWRRAHEGRGDLFGAPALAAIGVLLFLSPLFSLQYVLWLAPWAAVAWLEPSDRVMTRLAAGASLLTGLLWLIYLSVNYTPQVAASVQAIILIRDCLCGLLLAFFVGRSNPSPANDLDP